MTTMATPMPTATAQSTAVQKRNDGTVVIDLMTLAHELDPNVQPDELEEGFSVSYEKVTAKDVPLPKDVGHLQRAPSEIVCPACQARSLTKVRVEVVTCLQRFLALINCCLCCEPIKWEGRHDYNHYCSKCGCYIGRYIALSRYKRALFKMQRNEVEENSYTMFKRVVKKEVNDAKRKTPAAK